MDGRLSLERIVEVIERINPDVVALQELDAGRKRSGMVDQAREIARLLRMEAHFHPAMRFAEEEYGDAILSRHPLRLIKAGPLPSVKRQFLKETRGALWISVAVGEFEVQVINTHLGLGRTERRAQAQALLGDEWIGAALESGPLVVCGDFNSPSGRVVHGMLSGRLRDAQKIAGGKPVSTFATTFPFLRIDHVFVSPEFDISKVEVPRTPLTRIASDHFPLVVEMAFKESTVHSSDNGNYAAAHCNS